MKHTGDERTNSEMPLNKPDAILIIPIEFQNGKAKTMIVS